ncbi:MAG: hypothetical protein RL217_1613 [Pseudomonadota bacterium]|jgi:chemotaxis protein MotB
MENLGQKQNIIVRRIKKGKHGHHGGAWKVAMADFALAMMALFLVLWIINSTSEPQRKAISGYFQDPKAFTDGTLSPSSYVIDMGGTPPNQAENIAESGTPSPEQVLNADEIESMAEAIEQKRMESQTDALQQSIETSATLSPFKDQLLLDITTEGVRLQIVDKTNRPMFDTGSARLKFYSEDILWELAPLLAAMDNRLSISGHTDADRNSAKRAENDGNWSLSALRADAARKALMEASVAKAQIAQVIGMGDTAPLVADDPYNAMNRRIAIVLLNKKTDKEVQERNNSLDLKFINEKSINPGAAIKPEDPRTNVIDKAQQTLEKLNKERNAPDNSYDNPPNKNEAFW